MPVRSLWTLWPDPSTGTGTLDLMAKPNTLAHAPSSPPPGLLIAEEVVAEEKPAFKPASPERSQPIASRPEPELKDDALEIPGDPSTLRALVVHGSLRHDGKKFTADSEVALPAALAKSLEAKGVVRIIRRPA